MQKKSLNLFLIMLSLLSFFLFKPAYTQSLFINPEYFELIYQKINPYLIYPKEAITNGWEGIAKVRFTLIQDGRIKEIEIAESSGYPLLDAAAMLAIRDAGPYPFPKDYPRKEEELEVILPVRFQQPDLPSGRPSSSYLQKTPPISQEPKEIKKSAKESQGLPIYKGPEPLVFAPSGELSSFVFLALKNNEPAKVAKEEVELAQLKITEAERNLFPALKVSSYTTTGEVFKVDYEEREIRFQLDQPIFYGGRLLDTFNQAKVNLEITQKNYDRVKLDVIHKTETAYYNLVASKMHLLEKQSVIEEAKEMLEKIESLYKVGVVIPYEVDSARAWFAQIQFQIDSIKQDQFMAELTFKQVLNIKQTPEVKVELLEAKKLDIDFPGCLEAAFKQRPEIYLSELLVKFNEYGKKIKASESNAFTVDLTTSCGYYQGHYKTEPWDDSHSWYMGIKVSKPWGGSTVNTSYAQEETQPRFGQTSATASSTLGAELSLLDNLKSLSEKRRAEIDLHRSLSDFDETLKTISFEVQDAFLKYQKAILQLNTAEIEMKFRRSELNVMKIRALTGETHLFNALESLFSLSEAQSKYLQALANYYLSIANLNKATGSGLKI